MGIELVRERLTRAADALSNLDVSELDADEVRMALVDAGTVRSHAARFEMALTARADDLHQSGCGDDPVDLLTGVGAMPRRKALEVVRHAELLGAMPVGSGSGVPRRSRPGAVGVPRSCDDQSGAGRGGGVDR